MNIKRKLIFVVQNSLYHRDGKAWECLHDSIRTYTIGDRLPTFPLIGNVTNFKVGTKVEVTIEEPVGGLIIKED